MFRNVAFFIPEIVLYSLKASDAKFTDSLISSDEASVKTASFSLFNSGLKVLNVWSPLADCKLPI